MSSEDFKKHKFGQKMGKQFYNGRLENLTKFEIERKNVAKDLAKKDCTLAFDKNRKIERKSCKSAVDHEYKRR